MSLSTFTAFAARILVRDVMDAPASFFERDTVLSDAIRLAADFCDGDNSMPLVVGRGCAMDGYVTYWDIFNGIEDHGGNATVSKIVRKVTPDGMVSADTTLWSSANLFKKSDRECWFVLEGVEIVGTLTYACLFKPASRLCLFSLAVDLEEAALRLCLMQPAASWNSLRDHRRLNAITAAQGLFGKAATKARARFGNGQVPNPSHYLPYTLFIDKKTMLAETRAVQGINREELERAFDALEALRNQCAHPRGDDEPLVAEPAELVETIRMGHELLWKIRASIESRESTS